MAAPGAAPTARAAQASAPARPMSDAMRRPPGVLIPISVVALIVLAIGGYKMDWTWTGFKGNTLWDWLHLLVLPVVLTLMTLWIIRRHTWRRSFTVAALVLTAALVVLGYGGYKMDWAWTGFKGNTFWDWLNLLLLPVVLTVVTAWFSAASTTEDKAIGVGLNQRLIQENLEEAVVVHE